MLGAALIPRASQLTQITREDSTGCRSVTQERPGVHHLCRLVSESPMASVIFRAYSRAAGETGPRNT